MSKVMRLFWTITMVIFVGGCSSYRVVSSCRIEDETEMAAGWESLVLVGDQIRITLTDNDRVEGTVMKLSSDALTIEPILPDSLSVYWPGIVTEKVIASDNIWVVEKRSHSSGKTLLLISGVLVGTVGLLGLLVWASGGWENSGGGSWHGNPISPYK